MLTDWVDSKIKEQEGQIAEGLLYFKIELIDSYNNLIFGFKTGKEINNVKPTSTMLQ